VCIKDKFRFKLVFTQENGIPLFYLAADVAVLNLLANPSSLVNFWILKRKGEKLKASLK
jgi:hypothetical protein